MPCHRLAPLIIAGLALMLAGPALAQAPAMPRSDGSGVLAQLGPKDVSGREVTLPERTIVYVTGSGTWANAFDTLVAAHRALAQALAQQGITANGPPMTIYTEIDGDGFRFEAALPVAETPKPPLKDGIAVGQAPSGKAIKFVHRGSFSDLDSTYEAITDYLDEKGMDAKDEFIEEYVTDIRKASPDHLVVNIYVPVK